VRRGLCPSKPPSPLSFYCLSTFASSPYSIPLASSRLQSRGYSSFSELTQTFDFVTPPPPTDPLRSILRPNTCTRCLTASAGTIIRRYLRIPYCHALRGSFPLYSLTFFGVVCRELRLSSIGHYPRLQLPNGIQYLSCCERAVFQHSDRSLARHAITLPTT